MDTDYGGVLDSKSLIGYKGANSVIGEGHGFTF